MTRSASAGVRAALVDHLVNGFVRGVSSVTVDAWSDAYRRTISALFALDPRDRMTRGVCANDNAHAWGRR